MWPSIRHWLGSRMPNPFAARGPRCQAVNFTWERAGFVCRGPVAWSAESVSVEVLLRLPPSAGRNKADLVARIDGQDVVADQLRPDESERGYRAVFRFPPPAATSCVEIR